jgi:signal transduction histidine kinase
VHLVEDTNNLEMAEHHSESSSITNSCNAFQRKHLYEVCRPPFSSSVDNFDPHGPITQWVIDHRQLVVIPDTAQDQRIGKVNQEYQQAQIKSSLVVPVQANGTLHALLYLNQCSYIRYWSKHDQQLAQAVADQLAISLQQAYLYTCTQQQAYRSAMQAQQMSEMLEELRLTQAQLIQSEKMSSLGRIVAGVAHEINNPVNFIYGNIPYIENYVNNLLELVKAYQVHYPQPSYPIQKVAEETDIDFLLRDLPKILKSMEAGAERIHEVVKLLQKFAGSNLASLKVVDINAALESTLLILHNQITGIINVERHYDNLPPVECYPRQINQTFLSILTNAIEALNRSPNPDKILTLQTRWIPSREKGDGGLVQIAIRDNGPGIKLEIQPKIFEPFFTTKDIGQGRGLGLTMSYHTVVNQHNGQIEVVSQSGQGAEFLLTIPIRRTQSLTSNLFSYKEISVRSQASVSTSKEKSVAAATNS